MVLFIEHIRNLSRLNSVKDSKILDIDNAKKVLDQLRKTYYKLLDKYDLSETLKMHIICNHYEDYFELTGESLHLVTDEITEYVHSRFIIVEDRHGYVCHVKGSQIHVKKQHKSIAHFNSLNIGDVFYVL